MEKILQTGDIKFTDDGDFDFNGEEMQSVEEEGYLKQQIRNRIKTMNPDWFYDRIGSDLEELLGKPNTRDTAASGIELIRRCLTYDNFLDNDSIYIKPVPVSADAISYYLFVQNPYSQSPISYQIEVALSAGINIREVS